MPCDQVRIIGVEVEQFNLDTLEAALRATPGYESVQKTSAGLSWYDQNSGEYLSYANGKVYGVYNVGAVADRLRGIYAKQAVVESTDRFGWALVEEADGTYTAMRRVY